MDTGMAGARTPVMGAEPWELLEPASDWEKLVLPARERALIGRIPAELRRRQAKQDTAAERGLRVRFVGEEGTGKTLAARTLAAKLGQNILDVDLAALLPEDRRAAQQFIARLFEHAEEADAVLYFSWSHDRLSTRTRPAGPHERRIAIVVTGLLDRAESYPGLTIFADGDTERVGEAPAERFDIEVRFPFPGRAERLKIWRAELRRDARVSRATLDRLADSERLSGAAIHACCAAALLDASRAHEPLELSHIERVLGRRQSGELTGERPQEGPRVGIPRARSRGENLRRRRMAALALSATVAAAVLGFLIAHSTGPSAAPGAPGKHPSQGRGPSPSQTYASELNAVIAKLNATRASAGLSLREARTGHAQSAAAAELAAAHSAAAAALTRLAPGSVASGANAALATALRQTGGAYAALARAAARGDAAAYRAAASALRRLSAGLNAAYADLSRLGFQVG
jgi:hypothetical protein